MKNTIINNVSNTDIHTMRVTLIIPLAITAICSTFDLLFHIKLNMVAMNTFSQWMFWVLGTLISYFFPSFLAASSSLFWQYYFADNWAGIKEGKGVLLGISTLLYFLFYIVYLLFLNTWFVVVFAIINVVYVLYILHRCMDEKILKNSVTTNSEVINNPS